MQEQLLEIFNIVYTTGTVPAPWKRGEIVLLSKRPPTSKIENYRPICLISTISKLLTKIIAKRLSRVVETSALINDSQFGFRQGRSCVDSLFILNTALEANKKQNKESYLLFVDLSAAYDLVSRKKLISILEAMNFPRTLINFLSNYYEGDNIVTLSGGSWTKKQYQERGLRQGKSWNKT